jgi:hypothetical protein
MSRTYILQATDRGLWLVDTLTAASLSDPSNARAINIVWSYLAPRTAVRSRAKDYEKWPGSTARSSSMLLLITSYVGDSLVHRFSHLGQITMNYFSQSNTYASIALAYAIILNANSIVFLSHCTQCDDQL